VEREREVVGTPVSTEQSKFAAQNPLHRKTTNVKSLNRFYYVIMKFSVQINYFVVYCVEIKTGKGTSLQL